MPQELQPYDQNQAQPLRGMDWLGAKVQELLHARMQELKGPDPVLGGPLGMAAEGEQGLAALAKKTFQNEQLNDLFHNTIANVQRGAPEDAMLKVQDTMGGGVLNPVVEHVGDLTHRMTEKVTADSRGYGYVKDKVEKTLGWLTNKYGFQKEMEDNIRNNANYRGINLDVYKSKIDEALTHYANEHQKIPVYNEVQQLARDAAVDVGNKRFWGAAVKLQKLKDHLDQGKDYWVKKASEYNPRFEVK